MYFDDFSYSFQTNLIGFPIHMALCYTNIYVLMPSFLYSRKYSIFVLLLLASIFTMVLIKFNLTYYLVSQNVWPEGPEVINTITVSYAIDMMIGELYVVTFVTAIKVTMDWIKEHKRVTDLEKVQLETELLFLRSQISPHFFFNTLNNIYSLAIEKSDKTAKIVLRLSELMRYLLYETKSKRQSLEKEIICIQNYLELERVRHEDLLEVNMNISGNINDKKIAPIILLSFVENAFKHGVNKNIGNVKININFIVDGDFLYFSIDNPIPKATEHKQQVISSSGIGLVNVTKRLALGYKPNEYDLKVESDESLHTVTLKIKIK
jgi:sensor histidine kinase YesM|tara:strand:+ start:506 stop:1468 length:963 start_codon:yes stop_codon:yes gene_type:complete